VEELRQVFPGRGDPSLQADVAVDLFGAAGIRLLDELRLPAAYQARIMSLRRIIDGLTFEIDAFAKQISARLVTHRGWQAIQAIPGIGPIMAAVLVAEIGDVTRFSRPEQLCAWAGLTPRHRESDIKVHRGRITKQGSKLVGWACVEAAQKSRAPHLAQTRARIGARRGGNIAKVACARKLLTLVFYGLRDGHIRCLTKEPG